MSIALITSYNNRIFEKYAKRTFSTYSWPFPLYAYSEDLILDSIDKITEVRNIFTLDPECEKFVKKNLGKKIPELWPNMLFDSVRFCYKSFSMAHMVLTSSKYEIIIFVDADIVYSSKEMTENFIYENLIDDNSMVSYFGRNNVYSEGGFQVFNLIHPRIYDYMEEIRRMYISGELFNLEGYTDCHVADHVRKKFEREYGVINKNLSSDYDKTHIDPMASSFLNVYLDHLKGLNKHKNHHPTWLKERGMQFLQ